MKMKNVIFTAAAAGLTLHTGFTFYVLHEVLDRNASLPAKINRRMKKNSKTASAPKAKDERVQWMFDRSFTSYSLTAADGCKLAAFYLPAEKESNKYVLCSHGYRNKGKSEFRFITKFYHDNGYNVFLVDHRACGESEGDMITFGSLEEHDLLLWAKFMVEQFGSDIEIFLHGMSMGAATVLLLTEDTELPENVKFAISDCSYSNTLKQYKAALKTWHFPSEPLLSTARLIIKAAYPDFKLTKFNPIDSVKKARIPILFVHGAADGFVPVSMAYELYNACTSEKDILIVENAGHTGSYPKNSKAYEEKILAFTEKYLTGSLPGQED